MMNRRSLCVIAPLIAVLALTGSAMPDLSNQQTVRGTLTGIRRVGIRVPMQGEVRLDLRAMYYEARDFLTPRAPDITFVSQGSQGTVEVTFAAVRVTPRTDEVAGFVLISWGTFTSRRDQIAARDHTGPEPPPLHEVEGLVLWQSAPEYTWVEAEADLPAYASEQLACHLNRFLDAWFRDNPSP